MAAQNCTHSLAYFYATHASKLQTYLSRISGTGPADPDDVFHEVFEGIVKKARSWPH